MLILSESEEKRIQRPWSTSVIVKLLDRKIRFKALETRLKQIWVRNRVMHVIDLVNDYFLVQFSNK